LDIKDLSAGLVIKLCIYLGRQKTQYTVINTAVAVMGSIFMTDFIDFTYLAVGQLL